MKRTGSVDLPLHGGRAPRWLFQRMVKLSGALADVLVHEYGQKEFLKRISEPYWFQAFSCVIGFDWHSSGTTTTACGALKQAIDPETVGIYVAGGKGRASGKTPAEIGKAGELFDLSSQKVERLRYSSRLSAKVDNSCIQDGYQLYHHCFFLTEKGDWAVVQQGMSTGHARRYHWLSEGVECFVEEPHTGICCDSVADEVLDMTSKESTEARKVSLELVRDDPRHIERYLAGKNPQKSLADYGGTGEERYSMPGHHPVLDIDIGRKGMETLRKAYELQPENYEELVSLEGMGPKKIRALALVSRLVYGAKTSWRDPAKYSFAHGGKDGYPYPVNRETYDSTIQALNDALHEAKLERKDRLYAIKRLQDYVK
ncbi:MAG: DUF763 domain-containing protein [Candidatus Altiarchaeota archaeon]|nr:DUF763 domain-containing protein [Candidatus Altiarchaeota archaeon]